MLKRKIGILFISCLFMILLLIAIICVIFVVLPTNNSSQIAGAAEEYYEHRSTEMLRDVSVDFSFEGPGIILTEKKRLQPFS